MQAVGVRRFPNPGAVIARIVCRPFIGRADELAFLNEQRLALNAGRGHTILVAGEAGVGKSRLLSEFCKPLGKSRARIAAGQCLEFVQRPYGPILDVLGRLESDAVALRPAESKREHFDALVDRFATLAQRSALICIFEDLHWADAATLEFLAYLASRIDALRLLVIGTYRPEDLPNGEGESTALGQISRSRRFEKIELEPLTGPELRRFIDEALGDADLAPAMRRTVARMSEGNPFFTEELLKSAVEHDALPESAPGARRLSNAIRATVFGRLRPLDERARAVLAQAAVIGRRFDIGLLSETLPMERDAVLATLQQARELQLVDEESEEQFRFRHALTREAIYDQFLQAQTRPLHRRIALALGEHEDASPSLERLAYHWWAAGDREHGIRYNELAGDAAGAVFAHDNAIAAYERALALLPAPSRESAALHAKIGRHRASLGAHRAAFTSLCEAADILRDIGDVHEEVVHRTLASQSAHLAGIADPCAPLEAMLARLPADARHARSLVRLQLAWHEAGLRFRVDVAAQHLEQIDMPTVSGDSDLTRTYHSASALIDCLMGNVSALRAQSAKALTANAALPQTDRTVWVEINTAMEFACLDLRDEARTHFENAHRLAVARKSRNLEAHVHAMSASMLYIDGDLAGVRRAVDAAAGLRIDSSIIAGHCAAWGTLAGLALGDDEVVDAWFDDGGATEHRAEIEYVAAGYAEILTARGRIDDARALLHDAIAGGTIRRGIVPTLLAVARFGAEADFARARALLLAATNATVDVLERPGLALFDAIVEMRARNAGAASALARDAAAGFAAHRAPLLEAGALEVAGDTAAAMTVYRRLGAFGNARRLAGRAATTLPEGTTAAQHVRPMISKREADVARLVTQGAANLDIANRLSISLKTVEKHISAIYRKLGISTRAQLAAWVLRSGAEDG